VTPDAPPPADQSVEDLLRRLADEAGTLVRQELELARAELAGQARELAIGGGMVAGGGLLGLLSAGSGTAALILVLARRPRPWLAALTVSGLYAGGAAALALEGRRRILQVGVPIPEQTVDTLREGPPWATTPAGSVPT
jgi:hypothetical protein